MSNASIASILIVDDDKRNLIAMQELLQCLGQNLARATMDIGLRSLFARLPGLRLAAAPEDVPFKPGIAIQGMNELPVTW